MRFQNAPVFSERFLFSTTPNRYNLKENQIMAKLLFTSESVTEGHPDKICDNISDAILDAMLAQDPYSRVACETTTTTGMVMCMGEITTKAQVDIPSIVREVVCDIGYDNDAYGFNGNTCAVFTTIDKQSADIAMGVDNALEGREENVGDIGAGDQGMMFGYACDETPELMPLSISLAHKLAKKLTDVRKSGDLSYLRPEKRRLPLNTARTASRKELMQSLFRHSTIRRYRLNRFAVTLSRRLSARSFLPNLLTIKPFSM
jgi:S-adenosylmethionine synthetase